MASGKYAGMYGSLVALDGNQKHDQYVPWHGSEAGAPPFKFG